MVDYEKKYGKLKDVELSERLITLFKALLLVISVHTAIEEEGEFREEFPFFNASYGTAYENETFSITSYCWCEEEDCEYCSGHKPLFIYHPTGFAMSWYKYWPRDVSANSDNELEIQKIFVDCIYSVYTA